MVDILMILYFNKKNYKDLKKLDIFIKRSLKIENNFIYVQVLKLLIPQQLLIMLFNEPAQLDKRYF